MAIPQRIACLLLGDGISEEALHSLAEACGRFSPKIALRPGEAIFLDISGTEKLFSEKGLEKRLFALTSRLLPALVVPRSGLPKIAIAADAGTALAWARFSVGGSVPRVLPLEALHDYASPFVVDEESSRMVRRMMGLLASLGVCDLGEFIALPVSQLGPRFGAAAVEIYGRIRGDRAPAWPGFHPLPRVFEKADLLDGVGEGLEALLFILKGLLDRAMARLRGRCERAVVLEIVFGLERRSTVTNRSSIRLRVEFPIPQGSAQAILPLLRDRFDHQLQTEPLEAPVESLSLEVLETAPGRGAQRDFFSSKEEDAEALDSLLARLSQKLGHGNAFFAEPAERYLPEKAYSRRVESSLTLELPQKIDEEPGVALSVESTNGIGLLSKISEAFPPRPSRILKTPERLRIDEGWLLHSDGRRWRGLRWEGPERISGEWWEEGFFRDYYQLVCEGGEKLWVYLDRAPALDSQASNGPGDLSSHKSGVELRSAPVFFLHGFFD